MRRYLHLEAADADGVDGGVFSGCGDHLDEPKGRGGTGRIPPTEGEPPGVQAAGVDAVGPRPRRALQAALRDLGEAGSGVVLVLDLAAFHEDLREQRRPPRGGGPPGSCDGSQRLGVDVLAYLTRVIERLGTWKKVFNLPIAQLTPEAYKRLGEKAAAEAA